jgi:Protein of unknown function (DUF998)
MTQAAARVDVRAPGAASAATSAGMTRALLACGAVAGPLFVLVALVQAFTRSGFDITRYPPSLLSLGHGGWVQIADFVVAGLLFVAGAAGMRLARTPAAGTWGPLLVGLFGLAMVGGGVFLGDPVDGFPPGATAPPAMTWHGLLHLVAFLVGCLSLIAACVVFARRFALLGRRGWAAYSAAVAVVFAAAFALLLTRGLVVQLWVAVAVAWTWASAVAGHALAERSARAA